MKTVESGVDKPNALEPLDVRASVMLEWLMERSLIQRERLPLNQQPQGKIDRCWWRFSHIHSVWAATTRASTT